jgi:threonine-phosphate decarboxylase
MIEGHGNNIHQLEGLKMDFSSNVAARQVPKALVQHLSKNLGLLAAYPEPDARSLRKSLAANLSTSESQILVTNGSTEAFYLIANAFRESCSLIFIPSFSEYEDACRLHCHQLQFAPISEFGKPFTNSPDLVWLGNPNNPDGRFTPIDLLREKLTQHPETLFIVDEAYGELCSEFESALPLLHDFEHLMVIRSMTKQYVVPGLRLGYLVTTHAWAHRLRKHLQPWNVNTLAQTAGLFLLENQTTVRPNVPKLLQESSKLQKKLAELPGIEVLPSPCNFFLIRILHGNASALKTWLLERHSILLRDASNFRGLTPQHLRISAQSEKENKYLYHALKQYLTTCCTNG